MSTYLTHTVNQCSEHNETQNCPKQAVYVDIVHVLKKSSLFKVIAIREQHCRKQ
jgi:hypothetical protein